MSGGGGNSNDEANRLLDEQIQLQKQELEEKRKANEQQRMAIIKGQGVQQFSNPDNPAPPSQIIMNFTQLYARFEESKRYKDRWLALYKDLYTYVIPDRDAFNIKFNYRDEGKPTGLMMWDNTALLSAYQRANLSDPYESRIELLEVAKEYQKNPTEKNKKRYINLAKEVAETRRTRTK